MNRLPPPELQLQGKRILITRSGDLIGPMLCEVFAARGTTVIANAESLIYTEEPAWIVDAAGVIDSLVANLVVPVRWS